MPAHKDDKKAEPIMCEHCKKAKATIRVFDLALCEKCGQKLFGLVPKEGRQEGEK